MQLLIIIAIYWLMKPIRIWINKLSPGIKLGIFFVLFLVTSGRIVFIYIPFQLYNVFRLWSLTRNYYTVGSIESVAALVDEFETPRFLRIHQHQHFMKMKELFKAVNNDPGIPSDLKYRLRDAMADKQNKIYVGHYTINECSQKARSESYQDQYAKRNG